MDKKTYKVIGVMSGSSLDGLDIVYCELTNEDKKWKYLIVEAETIPYDEKWTVRLTHLNTQPAFVYPKTDLFYGKYIGQQVNYFINKYNIKPELISSHGHTVFHQPENGFTAQIGHGGAIHAETNVKVVSDFRTIDVMLGGQGAPLVPIGDSLLFAEYDACLNLGGFSNISFQENKVRKAFDISPCNGILNALANQLDLPYDEEGKLASMGKCNEELLSQLNELDYYKNSSPKSLGKEWVNQHISPLVAAYDLSVNDFLATFTEHISIQISIVINSISTSKILVTGGGAHNVFLIKKIQEKTKSKLIIPDSKMVDYKEALIFALLGVLRLTQQNNVLKEVTGAERNNMGGALFG